ncbi:RNA-guided endonuclease IscB [Pseudogracilibacillus auburnensis]|uniref:RNA-guided endonuclease IscB n=1 Tax=Pseudogracilibacillus auburnensis TaxID=1494959 RepID=UPI001A959D7F|nr:RNA-guided endonuclease IscB [Pseudogracilibacillus auburnensis]MBO1005328.1 HNH endonuclease [Pseudogracilibacillus auburnensis]
MTEFCFVVDQKGNTLSPTKVGKAWFLIRKHRAILVNKFPMVIQLTKEVKKEEIDRSIIHYGIDDGAKHVGIAIVQRCNTKNKPVFKGTIELRQDVKEKMDVRKGYRRYKRSHKRYREKRFYNRSSSRRSERIAPSIRQKKESILRVTKQLHKWIDIDVIHLEDVAIDIRVIESGYKPYCWQYQKSNRLDENLRKATIFRDRLQCMNCGKKDCRLEVHHIIPKRLNGSDSIHNLITLCCDCHDRVTGAELQYSQHFFDLIKGKKLNFTFAMHVMQGKNYLKKELVKIAPVTLTTGGDTANKRIDWGIEKSHSHDAIVISNLPVRVEQCKIKDFIIKPMRRKRKNKIDELNGFKHRDFIRYTKRNGDTYEGYITVLNPIRKTFDMKTLNGKILKKYGIKSATLLWRFNRIYWF